MKLSIFKGFTLKRVAINSTFGLLMASVPAVSVADIIWSGDFNDRNFKNYHSATNPNAVYFSLVSEYGRPPQYGGQEHTGNGDLLNLVDTPTRGSNYSARFRVKSASSGGSEPRDCDPALDCATRRTQLQMTATFLDYYNALPYGAERWMSMSFFVPADFVVSDVGWGPVIWGSKGNLEQGPGWAGLALSDNGWKFIHRYYSQAMRANNVDRSTSWWLTTEYSSTYPSRSIWPQGLIDFPDENASKNALANVNRGGWTDFIFHFRTDVSDHSSSFESNNRGFFDVYMRASAGPWIHVIAIRPMEDLARNSAWSDSNPERVYDRGIGQYAPGGYTSQMGLYMDKNAVWRNSNGIDMYMDNVKVGDERSSFESMTHDGSSVNGGTLPGNVRPNPPRLLDSQ